MNFKEFVRNIDTITENDAYRDYKRGKELLGKKANYGIKIEDEELDLKYLKTLRKHLALRPQKSPYYFYTYVRNLLLIYGTELKLEYMREIKKRDSIGSFEVKGSYRTLHEALSGEDFRDIIDGLSVEEIERELELDEIDKKTLKIMKGKSDKKEQEMIVDGYVSYEESEKDAMKAEREQLEWVLDRLDYIIKKPRLEEIYELKEAVMSELDAISERGREYGYDI